MNIKTRSLAQFRDLLNDQLQKSRKDKSDLIKDLLPFSIADCLIKAGIEPEITRLSFWEDWEYGKQNISNDDFILSVLGNLSNSGQEFFLLFDDCFTKDKVFELNVNDLIRFKTSLEAYSTLFEPLDHVFYFPEDRFIILLHHEGKLIKAAL